MIPSPAQLNVRNKSCNREGLGPRLPRKGVKLEIANFRNFLLFLLLLLVLVQLVYLTNRNTEKHETWWKDVTVTR